MTGGADDAVFQATAEERHDAVLAESATEKKKALDLPTIRIGKLNSNEEADLIFPTDEERETLPREPGRLTFNTFTIAFCELCERFGYYGAQVVLTNFIQRPLPGNNTGAIGDRQDVAPGALNLGQQGSAGLTTFLSFYVYLTPILGAYLADTYWGRFKTICISVAVAIVGHIFLLMSGIPGIIEHQGAALALLIIAILVFGLGTGGFKSNISPLIAEQYSTERLTVHVKPNGTRVIIDPALTAARVYNWFYLMINIGALVGQIGMTYSEKYVGFWLAFLLPTIIFLFCPFVLWWGNSRYRKVPPQGSVLPTAIRVWRYAGKGTWSWNPVKTVRNWDWTKAYPSKQTPGQEPRWMQFVPSDVWVDEVKRAFAACTVFLWFPLYWITYNQINNNLTSQAATLHFGTIPNDVINNLDPFALIILIPIFDILVYPALRKAGINFSPLKRITAGFFLGALAMMCAAIVQHYVYTTSVCGYSANDCPQGSPISVWVQTPSYVLIAMSEIFASITGLEYAFTKAPKNMRSLVMSIFLFQTALGNAISEAFLPLVQDPLLVWNYGVSGILALVGGIGFWISFRHLDKNEQALNEIRDRAMAHGQTEDETTEKRTA